MAAVFGLLGGQLLGNDDSPWPHGGPAALTSEQVAVAAALLWVVQAKTMLPAVDCCVHVDCLAAGRAATGEWAPVDALSVQTHNLELLIREIPGLRLRIEHVKGHAGDGWNEVADGVAKRAAQQEGLFAVPPKSTCRTFLDTNLSWVSFEMAARRTGAVDIQQRAMTWSEEPYQPFRLTPEQLIPTLRAEDGAPNQESGFSSFSLRACTFNVQGLGGNHRYMEEQFEDGGYQVVMLQETKGQGGQCQTQRYYRLATESQRHWGVAIWLSRTLGMISLDGCPVMPEEANIQVQCSTPRLLVVVVQLGRRKLAILSGHCPHVERWQERNAFLDLLTTQLASLKQVHLLLCGVDLNGRLPSNYPPACGDLGFGDSDETGDRAAQLFVDTGVWAPSTFAKIHVGDPATYTHHTGVESRIDYLLVGGRATVQGARSEVDSTMDNGSPNDDHRAVALEIQGVLERCGLRPRLARRKFDLDKLNTVEGKQIFAKVCESFSHPEWRVHPDEHCRQIEQHLLASLQQHFPMPERQGHASYIPDVVWAQRQRKCQLRWRTRARRGIWQALLRRAFQGWRLNECEDLAACFLKNILLYEVVAAAVRVATFNIRKIIAAAKDKFLRSLAADGTKDVASIMQRAKKAGVGSKARRPVGRDLPKLLDPASGAPATSTAARDSIWLRYFGDQEAGSVLPTTEFLEEAAVSIDHVRDDWSWDLLPSRIEIEAVLRSTAKNKCAGLDGVPSDALRVTPSHFAALVQPLYVKALVMNRQPIQWRGGVLYEAFKGRGAQSAADSYRSLYISSFVGKAMHRVMRSKIRQQLEAFLHPLHCGSRQGMPVLFPSLFVIEHFRRCAQQKRCAATIFVDTKAAYHRLVRQLATGDLRIDRSVEELFHRFGLDGEDISELHELILDGGMLQMAEIPGPIRAAVGDFMRDSWFTSRFTDGTRVCRSTAGSRPGASWADTIFAVIYARILYRVHETMEGEEINFSLPWDPATGIYADNPGDHFQAAFDTTWADDSAYAIQADTPQTLVERAGRVGSLIISAFRSHGLDPNLKRHKTSMLMRVRGTGATRMRRVTFASGAPMLELQDLQAAIPIVPYYKHLGCMVDPEARLGQESRHRSALAAAAYTQAKDLLLQNRDLSLATRSVIFQATVVPTYFNLEVWIAKGKYWEQMSDVFSRLVRRLLCRDVLGMDLFRVPLPLAHWAAECWTLDMFARRSRVSALISLAKRGPPILWAMLQNESEWCLQAREDLRWLVGGEVDRWPALSGAAWPTWWHILRDQPQRVKRRAHRRNLQDFRDYKEKAATEICLWYMYRQLPDEILPASQGTTWVCRICDKVFQKRSALSVHFFKTHGRCAEYRLYLSGTKCGGCQKEFWTQGRLEDHLRATSKCVRILRRTRQPQPRSKERRKNEADNYTPAPPTAGRELGTTEEGEVAWNQWQRELHEDLCDVLLLGLDETVEHLQPRLERKVSRLPLFQEEIQAVLDHLQTEVAEIHADKDLAQWTETQFAAIQAGLHSLGTVDTTGVSRTQRESNSLLTMAAFRRIVNQFDWDTICQRQRWDYGTQDALLFILPASWETVWQQSRDGALSTVVVKDPLILLPKPLREAWSAFITGGKPTLRAPASFWRHSLASPFRPFRETNAYPN